MTQSPRQKLGQWGEQIAAQYLRELGYSIVGTNLRTYYGEIDILVYGTDSLIFVEVKTRASTVMGLPEISVTPKKIAHMIAAAEAYMQAHTELDMDWQIDVISIIKQPAGHPPEIVHFEYVNDLH
jgi:putative endonuclease